MSAALQALGIADRCLPPDDFVFCIISGKRSERVPRNLKAFKDTGVSPVFFVAEDEGDAYRGYLGFGGRHDSVVESGRLSPSRNAALAYAEKHGKICVELSDDIQLLALHVIQDAAKYWTVGPPTDDEVEERVSFDVSNQRAKDALKFNLTPVECAQIIMFQMQRQGAKLGGTCIHGNGGFAFASSFILRECFILGDFMVIDTRENDIPRFDNKMSLKEDYDYTASHLQKYGKVCRVNQILIQAEHRENTGGAVFYRSRSLELAHIQYLKAKWPGVFYENFGRQGPSYTVMGSLPFLLEKRDEGFFVTELGAKAQREDKKDSITALSIGMRIIRVDGEDLRRSDPAVLKAALGRAEQLLYGYRLPTGIKRAPKRPLDLVFGFTPECPPFEVTFHWDKRDVSLGGQKEVEKTEFPSILRLQKKVAQHKTQRQPSLHEYVLKKEKESALAAAKQEQTTNDENVRGNYTVPRAPSPTKTPDSAARLRHLLNAASKPARHDTPITSLLPKRQAPESSADKRSPKKPRVSAKKSPVATKVDDSLLEQGLDMFMNGRTMGEITDILPISEEQLQNYMLNSKPVKEDV
eukprot:GEMP01003906.1.p1 GENE.GEMP01003906.1~~GEMP01003906.1.p1  ORF type:complete len:581 (+),score=134.63 GEMP01003906.1:37-1779(+)